MDALAHVNQWFWNENFWLVPNTTWADLERTDTFFLPAASDLWIPFPLAVILCGVRMIWEFLVSRPVGLYFGLREKFPRPPQPSPTLEAAFKKSSKDPPYDLTVQMAKKLDWSPRQVERWWRRRRLAGQPSQLKKFQETSWRFLYYAAVFVYGVYILWDKPWFWNTDHCWIGYPHQHVSSEVWYYYMVSLGFYWSLIFSVFSDTKRKDFLEQLIHHFATILLLCLSWTTNFVRVGTLILCVHDAVDYWLEFGKMLKYTKYNRACDAIFVVFTLVWFITRTGIYPFCILRSVIFAFDIIWPLWTVFVVLLFTLQLLHIIWSVKILQMVYSTLVTGSVGKDERSETEPNTSSEEAETEPSSWTYNNNAMSKFDPTALTNNGSASSKTASLTSNGASSKMGNSATNGSATTMGPTSNGTHTATNGDVKKQR